MLRVLMVLAFPSVAFGYRLTILHTNDMHSRLEETSASTSACHPLTPCYGGFARVAAAAADIRDNTTLFLNSGDTFQGTPYYSMYKWKILAPLMDMLGLDAMALGNHEFDDGLEGLIPFLKALKTPNVAANIDISSAPEIANGTNLMPAWSKVLDGVNVTVIGYITPDTDFLSNPRPLKFLDEVPVLQKLSKEAKEQGAKIVVALGHSGFVKDVEIARDVPDVDVVIGGHSDTFLYTGDQPDIEEPEGKYPYMVEQPSGKKVPVVQAYGYTKYLGHLILEFDEEFKLKNATGNPILLNSSKRKDPAISAEIQHWGKNMTKILDKTIGNSLVDLGGHCRDRECNLGNIIADAIVHYHAKKLSAGGAYSEGWTNAPICIVNGGTIRSALPLNETMGQISEADILTVIPFDNKMVRASITGKQLKGVLENSVARYDLEKMKGVGSFLQVSGLRVKYDLSKPPQSRVISVEVLCGSCTMPAFSPLDESETYSLIASEYVAQGGDFYIQFLEPGVKVEKLYWTDLEAVRYYLSRIEPIHPMIEGRVMLDDSDSRFESGSTSPSSSWRLLPEAEVLGVTVLALLVVLQGLF